MPKVDWLNWESREIASSLQDKGNCRICSHGEYWHSREHPACTYSFNNEAKHTPWQGHAGEILIPRINKQIVCPCLRYVPGDNLAYLEWLDENNGE